VADDTDQRRDIGGKPHFTADMGSHRRASEPVRRKVESGEAVVIPWSALLFRRRADVEGRDPPHLRP
jgi:hypothetical protein